MFDTARSRLFDQLVMLHEHWAQWQKLFGESKERVTLLNACAPWFFNVLQGLLIREVLLAISRLTDPVGSGQRTNLVIRTLLSDPALKQRPEVTTELESAVIASEQAAEKFRTHRNKYIAHLDHAVAVGSGERLVPGVSAEEITDVVQKLEEAYNAHGVSMRETTTFFDLTPLGGVDALVRALEGSDRWAKWQELQRRAE